MISIASSLRRDSPATRYQADVACSWGSMGDGMHESRSRVDVHKHGPRGAVRHEFTRLVIRLVAVFGTLGILAGCAARVSVREGVLLVSWMPPTTNTDGSPLSDLASYRIYVDTKGF